MSSVNQQNLDNTQDWQHSNNYCFGPQSPQFHCHHSVNSDQNYNCRPMYYPSVSSNQSGIGSDHALLQQFIQTQQMLVSEMWWMKLAKCTKESTVSLTLQINSVCQFNQLLWDQQREINNLNTAVLLVSEIDVVFELNRWRKRFASIAVARTNVQFSTKWFPRTIQCNASWNSPAECDIQQYISLPR